MAMVEGSYPFLAKKYGMHVNTLYSRVKKGMTKEEACLMPVRTLDKQINTKIELMGFNPSSSILVFICLSNVRTDIKQASSFVMPFLTRLYNVLTCIPYFLAKKG